MFLLIEICLPIAAVGLAFAFPRVAAGWFARIEAPFARLAHNRLTAIAAVGLFALTLRLLLLPILPVPEPGNPDEFCHLLVGDTLAHGRLANPTHPMWVHFETFHVIQQPTYTAMVYPAQGVFLAIGRVLFGHPFWGVWLSVGLMCAAICWALQGWLPDIWALYGGLLAVIRLGTFSDWANSYWGGAVAAMGGALVLGALPRIIRHRRVRDSLLMASGAAILANSRPFEGLFFCLPVGIALIFWIIRQRSATAAVVLRKVALPLAGAATACGGAMLYYFWRTTGSPVHTPYMLDMATYNPVPYFPWQAVKQLPTYHHAVLRDFYERTVDHYLYVRSHLLMFNLIRLIEFCLFFLGGLLSLPFFIVAVILPYNMSLGEVGRRTRFLLLVFLISLLAVFAPIYQSPHYAAPLTVVIYALLLIAMQHVRRWKWRGVRVGVPVVRAIAVSCLLLFAIRVAARPLRLSLPPVTLPTWATPADQDLVRARLLRDLERQSGLHLVIVRYSPAHDLTHEWVFNSADLDNSKVIWARDMGMTANRELINYFHDRHVWLLEPDQKRPSLVPYDDESPSQLPHPPMAQVTSSARVNEQ